MKLPVISDDTFHQTLSIDQNVIIDFYSELCGPCRLVEPALERFDAASDSLRVVKAQLSDNHAMRAWLLTKGVRVTMLPTLVLFRDGAPVRELTGANKILDAETLHAFAWDEVPQVTGRVVPTRLPAGLLSNGAVFLKQRLGRIAAS